MEFWLDSELVSLGFDVLSDTTGFISSSLQD